jgi:hypothetical protein
MDRHSADETSCSKSPDLGFVRDAPVDVCALPLLAKGVFRRRVFVRMRDRQCPGGVELQATFSLIVCYQPQNHEDKMRRHTARSICGFTD